jgi:hypothetical protein
VFVLVPAKPQVYNTIKQPALWNGEIESVMISTMVNSPDSEQDGGLQSSNDQFYIDDHDDDCQTDANTVCASNIYDDCLTDTATASSDDYRSLELEPRSVLANKVFQFVNGVHHYDDRDVIVLFLSITLWSRRRGGSQELANLETQFRILMMLTPPRPWSEHRSTKLWKELLNAPNEWIPVICSRLQPLRSDYHARS